jgi:hypothetical protein
MKCELWLWETITLPALHTPCFLNCLHSHVSPRRDPLATNTRTMPKRLSPPQIQLITSQILIPRKSSSKLMDLADSVARVIPDYQLPALPASIPLIASPSTFVYRFTAQRSNCDRVDFTYREQLLSYHREEDSQSLPPPWVSSRMLGSVSSRMEEEVDRKITKPAAAFLGQ